MCLQEAILYSHEVNTRTLYAGYFLDHVVTPIYEVKYLPYILLWSFCGCALVRTCRYSRFSIKSHVFFFIYIQLLFRDVRFFFIYFFSRPTRDVLFPVPSRKNVPVTVSALFLFCQRGLLLYADFSPHVLYAYPFIPPLTPNRPVGSCLFFLFPQILTCLSLSLSPMCLCCW